MSRAWNTLDRAKVPLLIHRARTRLMLLHSQQGPLHAQATFSTFRANNHLLPPTSLLTCSTGNTLRRQLLRILPKTHTPLVPGRSLSSVTVLNRARSVAQDKAPSLSARRHQSSVVAAEDNFDLQDQEYRDISKAHPPILSSAPVELSAEQQFLLKQVIQKKKSVFFTGSAGTGKSVLLKQLIEDLKEHYLPGNVAVTASTGIAACNIGGCTLHSFAGVGLGSGTVDQLMVKIDGNKKARSRWRKTKVLIIDEISMVHGEFFDKLEEIARRLKRSKKPFGGIQLIITGDFFQLPPVTQESYPVYEQQSPLMSSSTTITTASGDEIPIFDDEFHGAIKAVAVPKAPTLCFDSSAWKECIDFTLQLTEVFRQRDPIFIKMLTEMRHGKLSEQTVKVFKDLQRTPIYPDDGIKATELFALRAQVETANHRYLAALPGSTHVYEPQDSGPLAPLMDKFSTAPSKLQLKEDAQVMLIKNLTPTLVNGSMGIVVGFQEDVSMDDQGRWTKSHFPVVRFVGEEDDLVIRPEEWRMEMPDGEVMASRVQIPLILAWAMSIHKSQGQTMERVKVDMGRIFEAGQAYVALSRATSLQGLQVLNFDRKRVQANERVAEFYDGLVTVQGMMEEEQEALRNKGKRKFGTKTKALPPPPPVAEKVVSMFAATVAAEPIVPFLGSPVFQAPQGSRNSMNSPSSRTLAPAPAPAPALASTPVFSTKDQAQPPAAFASDSRNTVTFSSPFTAKAGKSAATSTANSNRNSAPHPTFNNHKGPAQSSATFNSSRLPQPKPAANVASVSMGTNAATARDWEAATFSPSCSSSSKWKSTSLPFPSRTVEIIPKATVVRESAPTFVTAPPPSPTKSSPPLSRAPLPVRDIRATSATPVSQAPAPVSSTAASPSPSSPAPVASSSGAAAPVKKNAPKWIFVNRSSTRSSVSSR